MRKEEQVQTNYGSILKILDTVSDEVKRICKGGSKCFGLEYRQDREAFLQWLRELIPQGLFVVVGFTVELI